jgi:hypothetical protein
METNGKECTFASDKIILFLNKRVYSKAQHKAPNVCNVAGMIVRLQNLPGATVNR